MSQPPDQEPGTEDEVEPDSPAESSPVPESEPQGLPSLQESTEQRTHQVGRNSTIMAMGSAGSRVLGFVRTALFALIVRSSIAADAFNVANTLPTQIYILISSGLLSAILIPQITKAMRRKDHGQDFVDRLLTLAMLILVAATVVFTALVPVLVRLLSSGSQLDASHNQAALQLAVLFGYWCMPQLLFYGLYTVLGQVLNARGRFGAYAWAPAWANVIQIIGLLVFWWLWGYQPDPAQWSTAMVVVLGGSTTLGIAVQGISLVPALRREGFRFHPRFGWRGYGFGEISRMAAWTFAAVGLSQAGGFVNTWAMMAIRNGAPDVAGPQAQAYAYALFILPHSMVTVSVVTALFPALSNAWQKADLPDLRRLMRQGLTMPATLVIPSSIALIALGVPIVRTLFMALSIREARDVALILAAYSLGILPFGITALKQRYCFAREDGWLNLWLVIVLTGVQMSAAVLTVFWVPARYGVAMIGFGHTLGSAVSAAIFLVVARSQLGGLGLRGVALSWARVTAISLVAGVAGWAVVQGMDAVSTTRPFQLITLSVSGAVFVLVFWILARLARITEVTAMVDGVVQKLGRRLRGR